MGFFVISMKLQDDYTQLTHKNYKMKLSFSFLGLLLISLLISCGNDTIVDDNTATVVHSTADEVPVATPTAAPMEAKTEVEAKSKEDERPISSGVKESANNNDDNKDIQESKPEPIKEAAKTVGTDSKPKKTSSSAKKKPRRGRAKAEFSHTEHDFGVIIQGEKVEHSFVFENTGDADLEILNVDVTCGCTVPTFPFIPIAPGEKGTISVTYNSTGKLGNQKPMITVITNASPRTYKLYFKGVVDAERAKLNTDTSVEN